MKNQLIPNIVYPDESVRKLAEIVEKMHNLGVKYAEKADAETNLAAVSKLLNIAERSFSLSMQAAAQVKASVRDNSATAFFDLWKPRRIKRSDLWREYIAFCHENRIENLPKAQFFAVLDGTTLQVKLIEGVQTVIPPRIMLG